MRVTPKEEKAINECYRRLFKAATPSADFDLLVENATIDDNGLKHIPFLEYELEEDKFESIITDVIKEFKIKPTHKNPFRVTIMLGCSPKTKQKYENKK
tara:strand:- start:304 stop:600 length:297 start_codon:yes stop_codon:yes gene_type:complete